jgi:hypothetical protein
MISAMSYSGGFRLIAVVLVSVLLVLAATPARAEAMDALTIVAIVGVALAGIVLIAYLVVANMEGGRTADTGRIVWMACSGDECGPVPTSVAAELLAPAALVTPQGP